MGKRMQRQTSRIVNGLDKVSFQFRAEVGLVMEEEESFKMEGLSSIKC